MAADSSMFMPHVEHSPLEIGKEGGAMLSVIVVDMWSSLSSALSSQCVVSLDVLTPLSLSLCLLASFSLDRVGCAL